MIVIELLDEIVLRYIDYFINCENYFKFIDIEKTEWGVK